MHERTRSTQRRSKRRLVASPVFVGAVAALLVNDHVLKAAWPGLVTGKLSDVAGVIVIAVGLTALGGRVAVSLGVTALCFALLKTVPVAAVLAAPVLGGVTRTDPTDLVALLALPPLGWWLARHDAAAPPAMPNARRMSSSTPLRVVMVGLAVLATTATSSDGQESHIAVVGDDVYVWDGQDAFRSTDGGVEWRRVVGRSVGAAYDGSGRPDEACAADACFSIVGGRVARVGEPGEPDDLPDEYLVTTAGGRTPAPRAIAAVPHDGGSAVVVWHPGVGVLHRATDGEWSWRPMSTFDRTLAFDWSGTVWLVVMAAAPLLMIASGQAAFRTARLVGLDPSGTRTLVVGTGLLMLLLAVGVMVISGSPWLSGLRVGAGLVELAVAVPVIVWSWSYRWRTPKDRPRSGGSMAPPDPRARLG